MGQVHHGDPFATPPEKRDPVRRLRGRLVSGVTIWTAGPSEARAGLTVSSALIAEGEPSLAVGLVNDTADLFERIQETGSFTVHVLDASNKVLADRFAGLRPSPGGLFADLDVVDGDWGPALTALSDRVCCRLDSVRPCGYQQLVSGRIERIELGDLDDPLVYFRGRYRRLEHPAD